MEVELMTRINADLSPEIDAVYTLVDSPSGISLWDYAEVRLIRAAGSVGDRNIWTVVESAGLRAVPGVRFINRVGYAVTEEPWVDEGEEYAWGDADEADDYLGYLGGT
jgi:hypothetical protein